MLSTVCAKRLRYPLDLSERMNTESRAKPYAGEVWVQTLGEVGWRDRSWAHREFFSRGPGISA